MVKMVNFVSFILSQKKVILCNKMNHVNMCNNMDESQNNHSE